MRGGEMQVKVKKAIEAIWVEDILKGIWIRPVNPEYIPGNTNPPIRPQDDGRGLPTGPIESNGY